MAYTYMVFIDADDGFRWEFHHIDEETIPQHVRDLAAAGGRVERGEFLAGIYDASTVNIEPHVHVDVIGKDGVHVNPLEQFPPLEDREAPLKTGKIYGWRRRAMRWLRM